MRAGRMLCIGIAVGLMVSAGTAPVAVSFRDNGQNLGTGNSWSVQLVDWNGDGKLDAYFEGNAWINDGHGSFTKSELPLCTESGGDPVPAYFADLNGDGRVDAVCRNRVFLNDGKNHFRESGTLPTSVPMTAAFLADLNGDGRVDIVVASGTEDRILLNDGTGKFIDTGKSLGGWAQCTYAVGDVNGDGKLDIYVGIPHTPPPEMVRANDKLWLGDGKGGFQEAPLNIRTNRTRGVILADLNGDGRLDLFLTSQTGPSRVYWNDGKGNFTDSGQTLGAAPGGIALAADFNGDGFPDVFVARGGPMDNGIPNLVWLNDGKGGFTDSGLQLGQGNSVAAAAGDLNGDGKPDILVGNVKNAVTKAGPGFNEVWLNTSSRQK